MISTRTPRKRALPRIGLARLWRLVPGWLRHSHRKRPVRDWLEQRLLIFLSAGIVILAALIVALILTVFGCLNRLHDDIGRDMRLQNARRDIHEMVLLLAGAESSQRGFLLSGDSQYLQAYSDQQRTLEVVLRRLRDSSGEDNRLTHRLGAFEELIRSKFSEMQVAIDNAAAGHPLPTRELLHTERGGELTRQLQVIDHSAYEAETEQNRRWTGQEASWEIRTLRTSVILTGASFLCALEIAITLILYLRKRKAMDRELLMARDSAVEANRAKSRFLAASSHDMRQPLHALNLLLRTLERRLGESNDTALVLSARAASASMARMFDGLLEVSRLDAGIVEPRPEAFVLGDLLARLKMRFEPLAKEKGLIFDIDAPSFMVQTDRSLLENILVNLICNALAQTQFGSITILARSQNDNFSIDVCDTGRGIPENEQGKIFEEFYRLEPSQHAQGQQQGLGLGLSIVRRITKLLFAEVKVRSQTGQGSVFSVTLPVRFPAAGMIGNDAPLRPEAMVDLRGKTMLLVDDEPLGREAMRCEISDWGMTVIPAADGEEALNFLAARNIKLDVAIVDCDPNNELSGPNLLDRLAMKLGIAIPAIIITSATDAETLQELDAAGYAYLIKPVDEVTLRRAVNEAMAEMMMPINEPVD